MFEEFLSNQVLIGGLIAWAIAQTIKVPIDYLQTHKWDWALLLQTGGMPSSHAALVVGITHGVGLAAGFDSPTFALGFMMCMVVLYDAAGIRRQAGLHAELINAMIDDLATGHRLKNEQLKEVLGHSPLEVFAGILLGLLVAQITWMVWR
jgi:hypothetical protein